MCIALNDNSHSCAFPLISKCMCSRIMMTCFPIFFFFSNNIFICSVLVKIWYVFVYTLKCIINSYLFWFVYSLYREQYGPWLSTAMIVDCLRTIARGHMTNPINSTNIFRRTASIYVSSQSHCKYLVREASGIALALSLHRAREPFHGQHWVRLQRRQRTGYRFVNTD